MAAHHRNREDVALSLTLAVVASSPAPLLLLNGELVVIAASSSFCSQFETSHSDLEGRPIYALGAGEWNVPLFRALIDGTVSGEIQTADYAMKLRRPGRPVRHLIVQARRLAYLDLDETRLLVVVSDVTEAKADRKAKEDAARKNTVLLMEVRHRVANSLQVIASVLLRNARKTASEETRGNLLDAHQRVMSVAALERLLSSSDDGVVQVHTYFTQLCQGISASMIGEVDQISLTVEGGDGVVDAGVSVSLGLIVTELVINALKHAFPNGRRGKITVDYNFHGPNWILCVRDDGVGMPVSGLPLRQGLGTSIVQALAKQLHASVVVTPELPGTKTTIEHIQISLVEDDLDETDEPLPIPQPFPNVING